MIAEIEAGGMAQRIQAQFLASTSGGSQPSITPCPGNSILAGLHWYQHACGIHKLTQAHPHMNKNK